MQKIKIQKKSAKINCTYRNDPVTQKNFVKMCKEKGLMYSNVIQQLTERVVNGEIQIE